MVDYVPLLTAQGVVEPYDPLRPPSPTYDLYHPADVPTLLPAKRQLQD